jgi:hypothetical protein
MLIQYTVLVFCLVLSFSFGIEQFGSFDTFVFKSDIVVPKIMNNPNLMQNFMCNELYRNIVENEFICIYPVSLNKRTHNLTTSLEFKFMFDAIKVVIDTLMDKNDVIELIANNSGDFDIIRKNFMLFHLKSITPINNIIKALVKYIIDKFIVVYSRVRDFLQDKYTLDVEKEEIILPVAEKIRYFSNETIKKYDDCLDFLNSLEDSVCITTKIENVKKLASAMNV